MKLLRQNSHFADATPCDLGEVEAKHFAAMHEMFSDPLPRTEARVMRSLGNVDECGCMALVGRFLIWANRKAW